MEDHKTVFKRLKDIVEKSSYQKDLHFADDKKEDEETLIRTHFLNIQRRETWSYRCNLKLDCNGDISNPSSVSYRVRTLPYHGLLYTVLVQKLPVIKANKGFEIRWCPNVGSNIVKSAEFQVNDTVWQTLDSIYFDDYHSKISQEPKETLNKNLGNVPELQTWSSELPAAMTFFRIPWFYSLHTSKMFPLYYCGKEDRVEHILNLRRNLKDLLMVRSLDTGEMIPFDEACITVGNTELPAPEMRGDYVMMSDMECEHNRCNGSKYHNEIFDIDNVRSIDSDSIVGVNSTVSIKIKDMPFPVHTIHWKAENVNASVMNYLSNYSTCVNDHTNGASPVKWASLTCPQGILFKNLESYICEHIIPSNHFNKIPEYPGYGCWTNATSAADPLYPKPGIKLDEGELTLRIEDVQNSEKDQTSSKYKVHARVVYTYRITFKDYPKTEAERNSKGIEVEVSGDL
jgi:hypothetical protein